MEKEYYFKTAYDAYELSMYERKPDGNDRKAYSKIFETYQDAVRYITKHYSKDAIFVAFHESAEMYEVFDGQNHKLMPTMTENTSTYPRFLQKTQVTKSYTI